MDLFDYKKDFYKLVNCKSLGFYNCVEKITIFLNNKQNNSVSNYFTIFVFDERKDPKYKKTHLTSKLISISDSVSVGIDSDTISVEEAVRCFNILCDNKNRHTVDIGEGELIKGTCEFAPKIFVPKNGTIEPQLNKVLKNNYLNGSYVIEFFDVEKSCIAHLNANQQKKINQVIYDIISIDLFTISDRIGNFLFQFPSINLKLNYKADKEGRLKYSICTDNRLLHNVNYQLICEVAYDDNVIGYGVEKVLSTENDITITVGDVSNVINTSVVDFKNNILLHRQSTSFIQSIKFSVSTGTQFGRQREIYDENKKVIGAIDVISKEKMEIQKSNPEKYMSIVERRKYNKRIADLINKLEFKQYGKINNDDQAIKDIIEIMRKASTGKVYLWDPYLCAEDIMKTWYYTRTYGVCLHAITSSEISKRKGNRLSEWIKEQKDIFETRSNNYGIKIEFRCQHDNFGYGFHDRFIMILNEKEKTRVWSIGTSFNSLGNSHHIIQEVQHPQMIVDAFEELWDKLSDETCLVWRKD